MTSKHISHGLEGKHRVAIVVPVYNVSKYLAECLDSALNQTYKEITIFAVNDGSTDDSGEILDEFAKKHSKLLVVHKSNGGVSSARNAGLDAIKNSENHFEFVYFLDSDDTIPNDFVQKLVDALEKENADVAICPVYEFDKQGGKVKSHPVEKPTVLDRDEFVECYYGLNGWEGTSVAYRFLVNKFFRFSTFEFSRFDETFKTAKDQEYIISSIMPALNKAVIVLDVYCKYRLRNSSLSRNRKVGGKQTHDIYFKAIHLKNKYSRLARQEIEKRYIGSVYKELRHSFVTGDCQRQHATLEELKRMRLIKWEFPQTLRTKVRILLAYLPKSILKAYCLRRFKTLNSTRSDWNPNFFD